MRDVPPRNDRPHVAYGKGLEADYLPGGGGIRNCLHIPRANPLLISRWRGIMASASVPQLNHTSCLAP